MKIKMLRTIGQMCLRVHHLSTCSVNRKDYKDRYTPRENAGIHRRLKLLAEDEPEIEKADIDHESMEELEQDFLQAAEFNDEILSEMEDISRARRFKITERKYFKHPKEPSMLTWSEKQQIVNLHQQDPEKWSPEVLAESFPASPDIIRKILKNKWKPYTSERLKAHDQKVSENWIAFHKGELKVHDPKLQAHLAKFTDRKNGVRIISFEEAKKITEIILPKPKKTEFLALVTSFKSKSESGKAEVDNERVEENIQLPAQIREINLTNVVDVSGTHYTLEQYRKRLGEELDNISEDREEIKAVIKSRNTNPVENSAFETYVAPSESFKPNAIVQQKWAKSKLKLIDPESKPDKITIPKEKWRPGLMYRVKDCFYNDRGRFLYRVPGLKAE